MRKKGRSSRDSLHGFLKALVGLGVVLATGIFVPVREPFRDFVPGKPAPRDVYAPVDFKVYYTPEELEAKREQIRRETPAVLRYDESWRDSVQARFDSLKASLEGQGPLVISAEATLNLRGRPEVLGDILTKAISASGRGLLRAKSQIPPSGGFLVIRGDEERRVPRDAVADVEEVLSRYPSPWPELKDAYREALRYLLYPSLQYDSAATAKRLERALKGLSPVKEEFSKGQLVISKGEILEGNALRRLRALREALVGGRKDRVAKGLAAVLLLMIIVVYYAFYARRVPRWRVVISASLGHAATLAGLWFFPDPYFTLLPFIPLMVSMVGAGEVALLMGILEAGVLQLYGGQPHLFLYGALLAAAGGLGSRIIRGRYQLYWMIGLLLVAGSLGLAVGWMLSGWSVPEGLLKFLWLGLSALASVLAVFIALPVFERFFHVSTGFLLRELSDLQHPLLQRLAREAPGTFFHSVMVGNMAEAAARAVGAEARLAMIGGYYHDIGKLKAPEYFIENLSGKSNPHDSLPPEKSAEILREHVSEGVRIAEEAGLPEEVIDFIRTHHGTSLMRYFYEKAKAQNPAVSQEKFRYFGPKPFTKEQGIVMLADSAEAACRALKDPDAKAIEAEVRKVVAEKLADGQLAESGLTGEDLEAIIRAFVKTLVSERHPRVEYPES